MNYLKAKTHFTYGCPEKEKFLSQEELLRSECYFPDAIECINNHHFGYCNGSCKNKLLEESTLFLFDEISRKYGFFPFTKKHEIKSNGKIVETEEKIIGFYHDTDKHLVYIHYKTNKDFLPEILKLKIENLTSIEAIYEGINYLLVKKEKKIFGFKIQFYEKVKDIISSIDSNYSLKIENHLITMDGDALSINMDDGSFFLISGLIGDIKFEEEERAIISERIENAQPFFEFSPYKKVDWTKLKIDNGLHFESLCEKILNSQTNLFDIQPIGKTTASDRGRDFLVIERIIDLEGERKIKWLVQCKFSENSISPKTIPDWTNRVIEHNVDGYWLMTNNDITPSLFDQLNDSSRNDKIKIETRIWQRNKFDVLYNTHKEFFTSDDFE